MRFKFAKKTFIAVCVVCLSGCSSSSVTVTEDPNTTALSNLATFIKWAGHTWRDLTPALDATKNVTLSFPVSCEGGGTIDLDGSDIVLNDCTETVDGTTYLARGNYTITESGSLTTHGWTQTVLVDGDTTFSTTGSISFNTTDDLNAFDFSGTFGSDTFRLTGVVQDNSDSTSDVTFSVMRNNEAWQDGLFNGTELDSLTDAEVDEACTDDDDPVCGTLECSSDFQCQIFADGDTTDVYESGNTECSSGCCALIADVNECPDSTPCSTDFQCQMFADNDLTDQYETNNVQCTNGCCALIE